MHELKKEDIPLGWESPTRGIEDSALRNLNFKGHYIERMNFMAGRTPSQRKEDNELPFTIGSDGIYENIPDDDPRIKNAFNCETYKRIDYQGGMK
jgi:hypothetical protein